MESCLETGATGKETLLKFGVTGEWLFTQGHQDAAIEAMDAGALAAILWEWKEGRTRGEGEAFMCLKPVRAHFEEVMVCLLFINLLLMASRSDSMSQDYKEAIELQVPKDDVAYPPLYS